MGKTTVIALIEPRSGTRRLDVALELYRLCEDVLHRDPLLIDMDPQCHLSQRLLKPEQMKTCTRKEETSGAWSHDFLSQTPTQRPIVWWNQDENVSFLPGWIYAERSFMDILHFTARNGFAPSPVEHLREWLEAFKQDTIILQMASGWHPMTRLGVAAADSTLAFLHADALGASEQRRIHTRFATMQSSASLSADLETLHFLWETPTAGPSPGSRHGYPLPDSFSKRQGLLANLLIQTL